MARIRREPCNREIREIREEQKRLNKKETKSRREVLFY